MKDKFIKVILEAAKEFTLENYNKIPLDERKQFNNSLKYEEFLDETSGKICKETYIAVATYLTQIINEEFRN